MVAPGVGSWVADGAVGPVAELVGVVEVLSAAELVAESVGSAGPAELPELHPASTHNASVADPVIRMIRFM